MKILHCLDMSFEALFNQDISVMPLSSISFYCFKSVELLNEAAQCHVSGWHNTAASLWRWCLTSALFAFAAIVTLAAVTSCGCQENARNYELHNELGQCLLHYLVLVFTNYSLWPQERIPPCQSGYASQQGRRDKDALNSRCKIGECKRSGNKRWDSW